VLGALGQSVGTALVANGLSVPLLGGGSLNASLFDDAVRSTVNNFGGDLGVNAIGSIAGSFSSLLFGEAAQALGLHGFAGGLFTTVATSITSQLAMNLGSQALTAIGLTNNFAAGGFVGNISGAIGGYFGSYLSNQIIPPTGIASSIGGRIGGAIGGFLASEIPVVGTFFGSLVGSVFGTLIGGLFDPHIVPWSIEMVGAVNGVFGINYWNYNDITHQHDFTPFANMVASNANQVIALTRRDPNITNVIGLSGINELVQHAVLVGSDPIVTGALAAARSFPRRQQNANVQRHARSLQPVVVERPHARLIHRRVSRLACG
jgi:hypothetical protein